MFWSILTMSGLQRAWVAQSPSFSTYKFLSRPTLLLAFSVSQQMTCDSGVCSILECPPSASGSVLFADTLPRTAIPEKPVPCGSHCQVLHSAGMKPGPFRPQFQLPLCLTWWNSFLGREPLYLHIPIFLQDRVFDEWAPLLLAQCRAVFLVNVLVIARYIELVLNLS